jgi:hypothetical protein
MAVINYSNPVSVDLVLDSESQGGSPDVRREFVIPVASASQIGASSYHLVAAAGTNAQFIKASAGQVYGWNIYNHTTYPVFVKLYNKASAPTVGTDVPVRSIRVAAGGFSDVVKVTGITFATGIAVAIVGDIADLGNSPVAANDCVLDVDYK